jgi:hypothetical protein
LGTVSSPGGTIFFHKVRNRLTFTVPEVSIGNQSE